MFSIYNSIFDNYEFIFVCDIQQYVHTVQRLLFGLVVESGLRDCRSKLTQFKSRCLCACVCVLCAVIFCRVAGCTSTARLVCQHQLDPALGGGQKQSSQPANQPNRYHSMLLIYGLMKAQFYILKFLVARLDRGKRLATVAVAVAVAKAEATLQLLPLVRLLPGIDGLPHKFVIC